METIKVSDVFDPQVGHSAVLPDDYSLEEVITRLAGDPCLRGVFLVDSSQRFVGVITRPDLLKWAALKFGGQAGAESRRIPISRREILSYVLATKAKEVASGDWRTLGVKPSDDLAMALGKMFEYGAIDIPVVDEDGRILGDLKLSQVLLKAVEVARRESA